MKNHPMIIRLTALAAILLLSLGNLTTAPTRTSAQDTALTTVRVGTVPVVVFAPLYIADAKGYFADEGIAVDIQRVAGSTEALEPLATGDLDVVLGGANANLFNYAYRSLRVNDDPGFRIVAGNHTESPPVASPLVVSKARFDSGEIASIADLEGGRVAVNGVGVATEYWMYQALLQGGIDINDVELIAVPFPDVAAALTTEATGGRIDAAILSEPFASFAEQDGLVVRLSEDFIDGFQATYLYMSVDFIENDRELAVGFVRAYLRANRYIADDTNWRGEEVTNILEEATSVPAVIIQSAPRPYFPANGTIHVEDIETLQAYFYSRPDTLSYDDLLDVSGLIDASLLDEALADLGTVDEDAPTATAEPTN